MSDVFSRLSPADRELANYALQRGLLTRETLATCLARAPGAPLLHALAQARLPQAHLEALHQVQLAAQTSFGSSPAPGLAPTLAVPPPSGAP